MTPRLMLFADRPLSKEGRRNMQEAYRVACETAKPIVVEPGIKVYQLVDGRWVPVIADLPEFATLGADEARLVELNPIDSDLVRRAFRG